MTAALSPILLANTGYHIGHQMSIRVAEEQGFFQQEGFSNYEYEWRGLVPGPFERDALDLVIREHGGRQAGPCDRRTWQDNRAPGAELRAFLRANIRAFWFIRDPSNFDYLRDLEGRLRSATHNEDEGRLRMVTAPQKLEGWVMPSALPTRGRSRPGWLAGPSPARCAAVWPSSSGPPAKSGSARLRAPSCAARSASGPASARPSARS